VVGYDFTVGRGSKAFNLLRFKSVVFESNFIPSTELRSNFIHNYSKARVFNIASFLKKAGHKADVLHV
jgi:hypothetical protein